MEKDIISEFELNNELNEKLLSKEDLDLKNYKEKNLALKGLLIIIFFSLIYLISIFRNSITWLIFSLLNILDYYPHLFSFLIELTFIYGFTYKLYPSFYTFLMSLFVTASFVYILYRLKLSYINYYIFVKPIVYIGKKIYFILHLYISFFISYNISQIIYYIFVFIFALKKFSKIYTAEDSEYISEFIKLNKKIFVLYTQDYDPNNSFYFKELSKLSIRKKGKFRFIIIHYNKQLEKELYTLLFSEYNSQPKYAILKGTKTIKVMEQFPKKEDFSKAIEDFLNSFEFEELKKELEEVKKAQVENKEEAEEDKKKDEKVQEKDEQDLKKEKLE